MLGLLVTSMGVTHGVDCDPSNSSVIELKWDMFAGETGLYTVEGCEGVSPTLHLNIQQEYKFLQQDESNWYHPVGFAYGMRSTPAWDLGASAEYGGLSGNQRNPASH
jgi:hypothetical protein